MTDQIYSNRWIPLQRTTDGDLSCFLCYQLEQTVGQKVESPVLWDAMHGAHVVRARNDGRFCKLYGVCYTHFTVSAVCGIVLSWQYYNGTRLHDWINTSAPGRLQWTFRQINFELSLLIDGLGSSYENSPRWMSLDLTEVNIGSGNGLVPSDTKPLHEPMLTRIYVAICRH